MRNASQLRKFQCKAPPLFSSGAGLRYSTYIALARTWAAHRSREREGNVGAGDISKANENRIRSLSRFLTMLIWIVAAIVV
jgi:hypothetical protein